MRIFKEIKKYNLFKTITLTMLLSIFCFSTLVLAGCKNIKYTISFVVDDEIYATVVATSQKPISMPENPSKIGYTFDGWFMSNELQSETFSDLVITKNLVVYAHFTAKTYNVTLDANQGSCEISSVELTYDENFTLPQPVRNGYKFVGWFCNETLVDNNKWVYDTEILTARWQEIIINSNGLILSKENLVPGQSLYNYPLYVEIANTNDCYIFVEIECSDNSILGHIVFDTPNFQKHQDKYYYLSTTNETKILFSNNIYLSSNTDNEHQNTNNISLTFSLKSINSNGLSLEDAYNQLFN